ncbi:hypothetical protein C9993_01405 [Marinobacter sp. Z-F4-2]|nr:hypothetical protein C9993_01405 [Marinobacter sp. Z-F4-2]
MMPVIYNPPYDSPIEDLFVRHYEKYAAASVELVAQKEVDTICGRFILDFLVQDETGYRVGIECDGKEFHEESRDEWRDAMILGDGHVDAMYRLRGSDINFYIEDILFLLAELEPIIFRDRAHANLEVLASPEIKGLKKDHGRDHYFFKYRNGDDKGFFRLEARRRTVPASERRFWQSAYRYAQEVGGGKLDDVIYSYRNRRQSDFI